MNEDNSMRLGVIVWRKIEVDANGDPEKMAIIEPRINEKTGDFCFRVSLDGIEPQLISGEGFGIVAISKREPPEIWTHIVVMGMSKDKNCVFIRFSYDQNVQAYLAFRRALARERETPELLSYLQMEPGFRRIQKPDMGVFYV